MKKTHGFNVCASTVLTGVIMKFLSAIILISSAATLNGCGLSTFTEPKSNPVIEDKIDNAAGTLATTAERRIVLLPLTRKNKGKFCAEPSPDAIESLAASFKGALDANVSVPGKGQGAVKAEIARAIATSVGALTKRTQGLQLYRDGVFALCQSRMNDFMSDEEYGTALRHLRDAAEKLIEIEIRGSNWNAAPSITVQSPAPSQ